MKLSEAIRLGSMLSKKAVGAYISHDGSACALGAAYLAISGMDAASAVAGHLDGQVDVDAEVNLRWPELRATPIHCPLCPHIGSRGYIVAHLNDDHGLPREVIASWYEKLEERDSSMAEQAVDNREVGGSSPSPATTLEEPVLVGA